MGRSGVFPEGGVTDGSPGAKRSLAGIAFTVVLLSVVLVVSACSSAQGTVRGVVTSVEGSLSDIEAFTVLVEGEEMRFEPVEDGEFAFPLPHLREHQRTGEAVLVGWESADGALYAVSLEDG